MKMNLYAHTDSFKTNAILIAAKYANLDVQTPAPGADAAQQTGRIAVLETPQGCIFSSMAIARFIARQNRLVNLYGGNLFETGLIDSWLEFAGHELEVPLMTWVLPCLGAFREVPEATKQAKEDVKKALGVIDKHLLRNTYMVGHHVTLADICICCALAEGVKLVLDEAFRKPFPNLMRWLTLCLQQPEFQSVLGDVGFCKTAASAIEPSAKGQDKKKEQGEQKGKGSSGADAKKEKQQPQQQPKKDNQKEKKAEKPKAKAEPKAGKKSDAPAEKTPEEAAEERKKKIKKVVKEGGKRGVEIEGAADMGGLQFFCTSVDEPDGELELMDMCMEAMNEVAPPDQEERKGCSGHVGKMIFSAGVDQLGVVAYLPKELEGKIDVRDWVAKVVEANGGEVVPGGTQVYAKGFVKADADKGKFPLKLKEPSITTAIGYLKEKGLFPDGDDDSEEMVFGDDDFPSM
eukprot:TRINITY_DN1378_c0_g3_i1.p1 TRINITY_DN1378_c0_g3~~TRINITY_DN1378_c0_g3_i1.p1  ORF type:complete len:460 (-),score=173.80 TRINITY_DN1378_c0_g3_i1:71-1450(-)